MLRSAPDTSVGLSLTMSGWRSLVCAPRLRTAKLPHGSPRTFAAALALKLLLALLQPGDTSFLALSPCGSATGLAAGGQARKTLRSEVAPSSGGSSLLSVYLGRCYRRSSPPAPRRRTSAPRGRHLGHRYPDQRADLPMRFLGHPGLRGRTL